jgi:hypothetical protein
MKALPSGFSFRQQDKAPSTTLAPASGLQICNSAEIVVSVSAPYNLFKVFQKAPILTLLKQIPREKFRDTWRVY